MTDNLPWDIKALFVSLIIVVGSVAVANYFIIGPSSATPCGYGPKNAAYACEEPFTLPSPVWRNGLITNIYHATSQYETSWVYLDNSTNPSIPLPYNDGKPLPFDIGDYGRFQLVSNNVYPYPSYVTAYCAIVYANGSTGVFVP